MSHLPLEEALLLMIFSMGGMGAAGGEEATARRSGELDRRKAAEARRKQEAGNQNSIRSQMLMYCFLSFRESIRRATPVSS